MTMHRAILTPPAMPDQFTGRGTRIPNLQRLLAVLAARQRILPTTVAMRSGNMDVGTDPADRMVRLFVMTGPAKGRACGAFNVGIARYLSGEQGEGDIYRGA